MISRLLLILVTTILLIIASACDAPRRNNATPTEVVIPEATMEVIIATLEAELSTQATMEAVIPTIEAMLGDFAVEEPPTATYRVTRVVDGDTVDVCCPEARVRLLGIDTPERGEPFFDAATQLTEHLTLGQPIRMERCNEEVDRYGRLLRHIFVGEAHVNRELVAAGLARAYDFSLNLNPCYEDELRETEGEAAWKGLGLWE